MSRQSLSVAERESFLAERHVGVMAISRPDEGTLALPIWYTYEPGGEVVILIGAESLNGRLLRSAQRFSLCVQMESPPYRYVSVEGPVTSAGPVDLNRDIAPMAVRYLGEEPGAAYTRLISDTSGYVRVTMRPERWSARSTPMVTL